MDFSLLQKYGIPALPCQICHSKKEALDAAKKIGYPLALKLISANFLHKSEAHALALNLKDEDSLSSEFLRLSKLSPGSPILVQKFCPISLELIIGGKTDEQFGPTVMVGLGGIYAEIFGDTQIRVCPISDADARSMISSLKSFAIIRGARGQSGANLTQLVKILKSLSKLMENEMPKELDINPLVLTNGELMAADIRVIK